MPRVPIPQTSDGVLVWLRGRLHKALAGKHRVVELSMTREDASALLATVEAELEEERRRVQEIRDFIPFTGDEGGLPP